MLGTGGAGSQGVSPELASETEADDGVSKVAAAEEMVVLAWGEATFDGDDVRPVVQEMSNEHRPRLATNAVALAPRCPRRTLCDHPRPLAVAACALRAYAATMTKRNIAPPILNLVARRTVPAQLRACEQRARLVYRICCPQPPPPKPPP